MLEPEPFFDDVEMIFLDDGTIVKYSETQVNYYLLFPDSYGNIKPHFTDTERQVENVDFSLADEDELDLEKKLERERQITHDFVPRDNMYASHSYVADMIGLKQHKGLSAVVGCFNIPNQELDTWYLFVAKDGIPIFSTMIYKFLGDKARIDCIDAYEGADANAASYFVKILPVFCRRENLNLITLLDDSELPSPLNPELFERNGFIRGYHGDMSQIQHVPGKFNVPLYLLIDNPSR